MQNGGFDVVIGNPPYVRQEIINKNDKEYLSNAYETGNGTADLYVYFYEKAFSLMKENGKLGFITSNKFYKTKYGKELREYLVKYNIEKLVDFFELKVFEDASTDVQMLIATKNESDCNIMYAPIKSLKEFADAVYTELEINQEELNSDIWVFADPEENAILEKICKNTITLNEYTNNGIKRGITTGLNKAFIIDEENKNNIIKKDPKSKELIKPYIAGTEIDSYKLNITQRKYFINTGYDIDIKEYKGIYEWLQRFDEELKNREDKGKHHYNLRACSYYDKFDQPKIIYIHTAKHHKFYYDEEGYYINNSTYLISNADKFLSLWLNSKIFQFYKKLNFVAYGDSDESGRVKLDANKMVNVPIPVLSEEKKAPFISLADKMLKLNKQLQEKVQKFVDLMKTTLNVEVKNDVFDKSENEFMKKIEQKTSVSKLEEWLLLFRQYKAEAKALKDEIESTDKTIDAMVYKLYGLSKDEIKIVEA